MQLIKLFERARNNKCYYQQGEHESTTHITSETENVENSYFYDAFGVVLESVENVPNRITYIGQQYYLRARNYNPVVARFTQEDVYRGDGLSLYIYCSNNPVAYFDPSGFMACSSKQRTFNNYKRLRAQGLSASEAYQFMKAAKNATSNAQREMVGEDLMAAIMNKQGYIRLPSKVEGNHGIDGLFIKLDKNGNIIEVVIGEAKFGNSRLGTTSMGKQMDDTWIEANIGKMMNSKDIATVEAGVKLLEYIYEMGGKYSKELFRIKLSGFFRRIRI